MSEKKNIETGKAPVKSVDTQAFITRKLNVLNAKGGAKNEHSAMRVITNNK